MITEKHHADILTYIREMAVAKDEAAYGVVLAM
jgi:hypothetical protein